MKLRRERKSYASCLEENLGCYKTMDLYSLVSLIKSHVITFVFSNSYVHCQLFGLGKAVLRTFIIELIYDGDCFKCWKYYYSVSHSAMMESTLSVVIFIIIYGSFMQCIVLFSVI